MRFKFYLRGCGLGIILAAIILMISFHKESRSGMSDEEVMRRAAELGMVPAEEGAEQEPATEPLARETFSTDVTEAGEPEKRTDTESTEVETTEKNPADTEAPETDKSVKIKVKKGEVCREIAEDLYKHGIISDVEEFRLYMRDNGYDNLICVGTYTFSPDMDYAQIAKILTSRGETME